jgi:hypothetical protein
MNIANFNIDEHYVSADRINAGSFTRLKDFEECPLRAWLKYSAKVPEPAPPVGKETPLDRGTRVHKDAELYVKGQKPITTELTAFEQELYGLHQVFLETPENISLEEMWCFDEDLKPVAWNDWDNTWLRVKQDAVVRNPHASTLVCIDFKGFPVNTEIPTPNGFWPIGKLSVGDEVFGSDGLPYPIVGMSPVTERECYEITFDDGVTVECDDQHLWTMRDGSIKQVTDLQVKDQIPMAEPVQYPEADLPIDPYVFGIWLADGKHTSGEITKPDEFIWDEIKRRGYEIGDNYSAENGKCRAHTVKGIRGHLNDLGVLGDKHIPDLYLEASIDQRIDLLRGIMDGDGYANPKRKQAVLSTTKPKFALSVGQLVRSLGLRVNLAAANGHGFGKDVEFYPVSFRPFRFNPFLLPRKASIFKGYLSPGESKRRQIEKIERKPIKQTVCISVASPDHTFLCTRDYIVTHNTGKKKGNEIKHNDQLRLAAVAAYHKYGNDYQQYTLENWYTDQDDLVSIDMTVEDIAGLTEGYVKRLLALTTAVQFEPRPNTNVCRFCPYKTGKINKDQVGSGHCSLNPC